MYIHVYTLVHVQFTLHLVNINRYIPVLYSVYIYMYMYMYIYTFVHVVNTHVQFTLHVVNINRYIVYICTCTYMYIHLYM